MQGTDVTVQRLARSIAVVIVFLLTLTAVVYCLRSGLLPTRSVELLSRSAHGDYEKATFSFEHGIRDDPDLARTRNDWCLEFGNGGDFFNVSMITDDRSRIEDLGRATWPEIDLRGLPALPAYLQPTRDPQVRALPGHVYLVHAADPDTNLYALFRVDDLAPDDRCRISWRPTTAAAPPWWPAYALYPLLIGVLAWSGYGTGRVILLGARGTHWRRRGRCPACGHPAGVSVACTECGHRLALTRGPLPSLYDTRAAYYDLLYDWKSYDEEAARVRSVLAAAAVPPRLFRL